MKSKLMFLRTLALVAVIVAHAVPAAAAIQIAGLKLRVTTGSLEVTFESAAVTGIRNLATGEQYIVKPGPSWLQLKLLEGGDIRPFSLPAWQSVYSPEFGTVAVLDFVESGVKMRMQVGIDPAKDEIAVRVRGALDDTVTAEPGVISGLWGITGLSLNPGRLVIPAQAGTFFDLTSQPDLIALDYPVHWEHGFVVYETGQGGFLIYANDDKPFFKRLHASRQTGNLDMALEYFAVAPWRKAREVMEHEWRLSGFAGDWRTPTSRYKQWLSGVRPNVPADGGRAWMKDIRGVITLQTLDLEVLNTLAANVVPEKTLLYIADWRRDSYDVNYPDYTPSSLAKDFVDKAHALGFRVMAHVNLLGVSQVNPHYESLKQFQIKAGHDLEPLGWLWGFPEGHPLRIAYISPASSAYRRVFIDSVRPAIQDLHLDALHLDAGGAIVNDGNGLIEGMTSIQGIMELHRDLIREFPDLVLGGESTNEVIAPFNWVAQRWTSESPAHPISTFLAGDQVRFYGFLDQPAADYPGFVKYVNRYEGQGILPTVQVTHMRDLGPDRLRTHDLLKQMKLWQEAGFDPDWQAPWEDRPFLFQGSNGRSAQFESGGESVRLRVDGEVLYERSRNVTSIETDRFIANWPAYDDKNLYGLDANRQYWIERDPYRPQGLPHLRELPPNVTIGTGTLITPTYGYFDLATAEGAARFNFVESFKDTRSGTIYGNRDYPVAFGAATAITQLVVGGQLAPRVLLMSPPYQGPVLGGAIYSEYRVPVPRAPRATLAFEAALADGTYLSDGVLMVLRINGEEKWRSTMQADGWHPVEIDLTPYAGTDITVRLIAHPGPRGNAFLDWACWTNLRIVADLTRPWTSLFLELAAPGRAESLSRNAIMESLERTTAQVRVDIPGSFVFFSEPPPSIALKQSLLDLKFDVWRADYGGLPYPYLYENSGEISIAASDTVEKARSLSTRPARDSVTIATFPVRLPPDATQLSFSAGLLDPPAYFGAPVNYTGVKMSLRINETEVWSEEIRTAKWRDLTADLTRWAGQDVLIQLSVDSLDSATFDWGQWAGLIVE
jgi:hypothetical protein